MSKTLLRKETLEPKVPDNFNKIKTIIKLMKTRKITLEDLKNAMLENP